MKNLGIGFLVAVLISSIAFGRSRLYTAGSQTASILGSANIWTAQNTFSTGSILFSDGSAGECWDNGSNDWCIVESGSTTTDDLLIKSGSTIYYRLSLSTGILTATYGVTVTGGLGFNTGASGSYNMNSKLLTSTTAPTLSGFGTSPSVVASNGNYAFSINVGTGGSASTGTLTFPASTTGWSCACSDITNTDSHDTQQNGSSTTTCTLKNYSRTTGAAQAWTASDILFCQAHPF